jgi:hypothetical protein
MRRGALNKRWTIRERPEKRWRRFVYLAPFDDEAKALGLTDDDRRELELALCENPLAGELIVATGGCRKMRFAPRRWGTGKRGALRVYYVWFPQHGVFVMIYTHRKNEQESISHAEQLTIKALIHDIERYLNR